MDTNLSSNNPVLSIPKPEFKKNGKPVSPKLKKPDQVRKLWKGDWDADIDNRLGRAWVQGMLEGKPPYNPARMKEAGLGGCCNIDWRYGQLAIRRKMEPYVTMLNSVPVFLNIRTRFGSPQDRESWGKTMSDVHARILRSWESFPFRHQFCVLYLASHGASFCYFNDDTDWRWHVSTMGEMVLPRLTKADMAEFPRMSMQRDYEPDYLWEQIKEAVTHKWEWTDPENKCGWHVPTVKAAIEQATYKEFFKTDDYEQNELLWKNKETVYSQSPRVASCIMLLNKEDDGSVTQYITSRNPLHKDSSTLKEDQFLYKKPCRYRSMRQAVVTFTRDIGTNGFFHSIRGTGSDIFPIVQELNKMECAMYDAIKMEMTIPVRATDEVWNSDMAYVSAGPFTLIREGITIQERRAADYSKSAFPGIASLKMNLAQQSGQSEMPDQPGDKIDLKELLQNMSGIDVMESVLFSNAFQRLLRESLRRLLNIKSQAEPGGAEAFEFRRLCMEEGVPEAAIDGIDVEACTVVRGVGNGSPQARMFTMQAMKELVPFMDEEGRANWTRDTIASLPGVSWDLVDRYAPEVNNARPTQQVRNALAENIDLKMMGSGSGFLFPEDVPVLPNDDHIVHLEQHAPAIEKIVAMCESGELLIEEAVRPLYPLYIHASQHLEWTMDNPIMRAQIAQFRRAMHNAGEVITNGQRKLQKQNERQMKEQGQGQNGEEGEPRIYPDPLGTGAMLTPSEMAMVARTQIHLSDAARNAAMAEQLHNMKIESLREDAEQKRQKRYEDRRASQQKRQINDLKAAVSIAPIR